jgi:hypothetical protein
VIINYNSVVNAIEEGIKEYTSSPDFKESALWQDIVTGMTKAIYILDETNRNNSYHKAISGLDRDCLKNLKKCIDARIFDIDKEPRVELYRLTVDSICYYYPTAKAAKADLLKRFNDWFGDGVDELEIEIESISIPESELASYRVIK